MYRWLACSVGVWAVLEGCGARAELERSTATTDAAGTSVRLGSGGTRSAVESAGGAPAFGGSGIVQASTVGAGGAIRPVTSPPEVCDGIDNDQDGTIDEGFAVRTCGVGACRNSTTLCTGQEVCVPLAPSPEQCNGLDDDCDGMIDEGSGLRPGQVYDLRTNELTTGDCTSCSWAFGPVAWQAPDGIHALFRLGFNGTHPSPNVFLGGFSTALERKPQRVLFEQNTTVGFELAIGSSRIAVAACARFASNDRPAVFWLDHSGELLGGPERLTQDNSVSCYQSAPGVAFTGSRFLVGWYANGPVRLSCYDTEGVWLHDITLADLGNQSLPPRFGVSGDRVLAVAREGARVVYWVLDLEGNLLTESHTLVDGEPDWRNAGVSATNDGWLVIGQDSRSSEYTVALIKRDGELNGGSTLISLGGAVREFVLAKMPSGGHLFVGSMSVGGGMNRRFARRLDDFGTVVDEWLGAASEQGYFQDLHVLAVNDRAYLIYAEPCSNSEPNAVRMVRLECGF